MVMYLVRHPMVFIFLAVACDVYDGVFFVLAFFPRGVLDEIWNLIESVSVGFPSYSLYFSTYSLCSSVKLC